MALRHLGILASSVLVLTAFLACNENSGGPAGPVNPGDTIHSIPHDTAPAPKAATLDISGDRGAQVNQTVSLSAVVKDSTGAVLTGQTIVWSSSDTNLVRIGTDGTVTARRIGSVVITALIGTVQDTIMFATFLSPYSFTFADTTPASERRLILDAVQDAHAFELSTFGRVIAESTSISGLYSVPGCSNGGAAAFASGRNIAFCLGNPGWKNLGPVMRQKIVHHELFHVWQTTYWNANPAASAIWILEGAAELMGFSGIAAKGLLSIETGLGCQVKESSDFAASQPPGLPALSTVESKQAFQSTVGPLYTHSMLGVNSLTAGAGGLTALRVYGDSLHAGVAWQTAFTAAFGKAPATFYSEFPAYRAGLMVPPTYLCRI